MFEDKINNKFNKKNQTRQSKIEELLSSNEQRNSMLNSAGISVEKYPNFENDTLSSDGKYEEEHISELISFSLSIINRGYTEKAVKRAVKDFLNPTLEEKIFKKSVDKIEDMLKEYPLDNLLEYIDLVEKISPGVIDIERITKDVNDNVSDFCEEIEVGAIQDGSFTDVCTPQKKVEEWVENVSKDVLDILLKEDCIKNWDVKSISKISFSMLMCIDDTLHPLAKCIINNPSEKSNVFFSVSFKAFSKINGSVVGNVLRELIKDRSDGEIQDLLKSLYDFSKVNVKTYALPVGELWESLSYKLQRVKEFFVKLQRVSTDLEKYVEFKKMRPLLENHSLLLEGIGKKQEDKKITLPFGEVFFSFKGHSSTDKLIILHYDGRRNLREFMILDKNYTNKLYDFSFVDIKNKKYTSFSCDSLMGGSIDLNDKVYLGILDVFAPAMKEANYKEICNMMLLLEAAGRDMLMKIWDHNPKIFNNIQNPISIAYGDGQVSVIADSEYFDMNFKDADIWEEKSDGKAQSLYKTFISNDANIMPLEVPDDLLSKPEIKIEKEEEEILSVNEQESILWKNIMSNIPNNGWFTLEWLEKKLKLLGDLEIITDRGKGSHKMMSLTQKNNVVGSWPFSRKMSESSLPSSTLKEALKSLKVSYEDFLGTLKK